MNTNSSIIKIDTNFALHTFLTAVSENGVHGLRISNQKLQYKQGDTWKNVLSDDIVISPNANNALKKLPNGYFVQSFLISSDSNNALVKKYDGYYVQKELNVAHISDINTINNRIDTEVYNINENINIISDKLLELSCDLTKVREFTYEDNTNQMALAADTSLLISPIDYVILNVRILVENKSNNNTAEFMTSEHDITTMTVSLDKLEIQQYDLGNATSLKVYANGNVKLYMRITYI